MVLLTNDFLNWPSHPGKPLRIHTEEVRDRAIQKHDSPIVRISSLFHDVGKLNPNFPKHLFRLLAHDEYKNHAYLSFLVFYNWCFLKHHTNLLTTQDQMISTAMCIIKHHGSLCDIGDTINTDISDGICEWERMKEFLATNPTMHIDQMLSYFGLIQDSANFLNIPPQIPLQTIKAVKDPLNFYFETRMAFSALIAADKQSAGDYGYHTIDMPRIRKRFFDKYESQLKDHMKKLGKVVSPINTLRTEICETARTNLRPKLKLGQRVFSLTCPTGSGKTLMLLHLALDIMKYAGKNLNIIYSVPFLSITEQVFDICQKIFATRLKGLRRIDSKSEVEDLDDNKALGRLKNLMKKFFTSVTKVKLEKSTDILLTEEFLESTFDYPFIVTTFVQLFEVFTTRHNKSLMKYSNLKNCIFLIDELQALPPRLYTFFTAMLEEHCRRYNCYAILSTATMPCFDISKHKAAVELFRGYRKPEELSDLNFYSHDVFNRYSIQVRPGTITRADLAADILSQDKSSLVILNTIRDSREVYRMVKAVSKAEVMLLNSNFHSDARLEILQRANGLLGENKKVILITTQLIEAGVDIDFPVVYRDIAPLPNIIQAAGRCNRNGSTEKGVVVVFQLKEDGRLRATTIYNGLDAPFLEFAVKVFYQSGKSEFAESELMQEQMSYFTLVADNMEFGSWTHPRLIEKRKERYFTKLIKAGRFGSIGEFKLIPLEHYENQYRFYVPEGAEDKSFAQLLGYGLKILELDENKDQGDHIRQVMSVKRQQRIHLKKMSRRMVQTLIHGEGFDITPYVTSPNVYMNMYELKPEYYDNEFGLVIDE